MKTNLRILVIDDNRAIHDSFRKILCPAQSENNALDEAEAVLFDSTAAPPQRLPFEIDSAYQGQEGLNLAEKALRGGRPYALAFVDVRMPPGWDGIETTARIWQAEPDLQIVICTAYSDYSWEQMMARLGRSDRLLILKKPFEPVEVLQLAAALTEKWRLHQEAKRQLDHLETLVQERTRVLRHTNERLETEIAERQRAQAERELLIAQLREALASVQTLSGLIPICASCKKIRDDQGFWQRVETYITEHSDAKFSHGLCPECTPKFFPGLELPAVRVSQVAPES
ncbi:MAG: response regulator [Verrucomicrobiota bacterium]|jgi:CheY-like chemotaxis protein